VSRKSLARCAAGGNWLGQLVGAVMNGPQGDSTAVFITWDDCGSFYDQVQPGTNPDGTPQGPRVPMVIISPWVRSGYTNITHTTFAGVLSFTEAAFGLQWLSANDAGAYDYSGAFKLSQSPPPAVRMRHRRFPKASTSGGPRPSRTRELGAARPRPG
jgi:phospholipase C